MDRRHFMKHLAAASAGGLFSSHVPRLCAWAQEGEARPQFFMFIFAAGGWDPTMVFEIKAGLQNIDVDPAGDSAEAGGIQFFHNAARPWVQTFFQDFGNMSCVINGVNTMTVSHEVGEEIMLTGDAGVPRPDWPTIVASENGEGLPVPNMALSGPSYAGNLGQGTASGSGFLTLLLNSGSFSPANATAELVIDAYRERRFENLMNRLVAEGRTGSRMGDLKASNDSYNELKDLRSDLGDEFLDLDGLAGEGIALATAFQRGFAITGSIYAPGQWDSHSNNYGAQNQNFDNTFRDLHSIVTHLSNQPATAGAGSLIDQTTLIVMSEFGRTPKLNSVQGKDHWPITTVLAIGANVRGSTTLGGTDDYQNSVEVDFATGLPLVGGSEIGSQNLGSAFLQLAGIDPDLFLPSAIVPFDAFLRQT